MPMSVMKPICTWHFQDRQRLQQRRRVQIPGKPKSLPGRYLHQSAAQFATRRRPRHAKHFNTHSISLIHILSHAVCCDLTTPHRAPPYLSMPGCVTRIASKLGAEPQGHDVLRVRGARHRRTAPQPAVIPAQEQVAVNQVSETRAGTEDIIGPGEALETVV